MNKRLVVVESPNKIAKVSKCLGPEFTVVATGGHFRDLPENELGVDVSSFTPQYETLPGKAAVVARVAIPRSTELAPSSTVKNELRSTYLVRRRMDSLLVA